MHSASTMVPSLLPLGPSCLQGSDLSQLGRSLRLLAWNLLLLALTHFSHAGTNSTFRSCWAVFWGSLGSLNVPELLGWLVFVFLMFLFEEHRLAYSCLVYMAVLKDHLQYGFGFDLNPHALSLLISGFFL